MARFVIIDNSIVDSSGHHYQYAVHCLTAAQELGYEPILAVNKNNQLAKASWKVFPAYSGTFWEYDRYEPTIMSFYHKLENLNNKFLNFAILNFFGPFLLKKLLDKKKIAEFATETFELIKQIDLAEGDIVFLPTSGFVEMFGILECAKTNYNCKKASWHFLFRRNIQTGPPHRSFPYIKLGLMKKIIQTFHKNLILETHFYTDSIQLTEEYDKLGIKFGTLPIPHTITKSEPRNLPKTINITYLGDARQEKGFHHLPHIIQDLWHDYVQSGKTHFTIQSYLGLHPGDPKTIVSLHQLQNFSSDKVTLVPNPLSPEEYQNLLVGSDVVLLPYDQVNYYARTSGILVEALGCGIPVVVPEGTWLSRQFIRNVYQYQRSLREKYLKKSYDSIEMKPEGNNKKNAMLYTLLEIDKENTHIIITLFFKKKISESASIPVETIQMTSNELTISSNSNLVENSELGYGTILLPIKNPTKKIKIRFKNLEFGETIQKISADILYVNQKEAPLSVVGITYGNSDDI